MTHCIQHVQSFHGFTNELLQLQVRSGLKSVRRGRVALLLLSLSMWQEVYHVSRSWEERSRTGEHFHIFSVKSGWFGTQIIVVSRWWTLKTWLWLFFLSHQQLLICGFEWNISTTIGLTAIKSGSDVHAPLRMNGTYPGDPFSPAQSSFQFGFMTKNLENKRQRSASEW